MKRKSLSKVRFFGSLGIVALSLTLHGCSLTDAQLTQATSNANQFVTTLGGAKLLGCTNEDSDKDFKVRCTYTTSELNSANQTVQSAPQTIECNYTKVSMCTVYNPLKPGISQ